MQVFVAAADNEFTAAGRSIPLEQQPRSRVFERGAVLSSGTVVTVSACRLERLTKTTLLPVVLVLVLVSTAVLLSCVIRNWFNGLPPEARSLARQGFAH